MTAIPSPGQPEVLAWQAEVRQREALFGGDFPRVVALGLHNHLPERVVWVGVRPDGSPPDEYAAASVPLGGVAPGACCALGEFPIDFAHVCIVTESGMRIRSGPALLSPERPGDGLFLHPQLPQESAR